MKQLLTAFGNKMHIIDPYRHAAVGGAIPVVASFSETTALATTIIVATDPGGISSGDFLVLLMTADQSTDPYISTPTGWTKLIGFGANGAAFGIFYKVATGSEGDVSVTVNAADHIAWYLRITGGGSVDVNGSGSTSSTNQFTIPEVTTTVDNCLAFYLISFDGGEAHPWTIGAGTDWTLSATAQAGTGGANNSGSFGTKEMATAGATGTVRLDTNAFVVDGAAYLQLAIAPA